MVQILTVGIRACVHCWEMSTSLTRRRAVVAAATADAEARESRIATTEATVQQAAETARAVAAATEVVAAAAVTLRAEDDDDRELAQLNPHKYRRGSPSPQPRRGHHHRRGSPPVVQHVIKESSGSTTWPMLTKMSYNDGSPADEGEVAGTIALRCCRVWRHRVP
jgi:hypothetical protein